LQINKYDLYAACSMFLDHHEVYIVSTLSGVPHSGSCGKRAGAHGSAQKLQSPRWGRALSDYKANTKTVTKESPT
jgi:hypothetical protein